MRERPTYDVPRGTSDSDSLRSRPSCWVTAIDPYRKSKLSTVSAATSPQRSPSTAPSQTMGPWSPSPSATAASWSTSRAGRSTNSAAGSRI